MCIFVVLQQKKSDSTVYHYRRPKCHRSISCTLFENCCSRLTCVSADKNPLTGDELENYWVDRLDHWKICFWISKLTFDCFMLLHGYRNRLKFVGLALFLLTFQMFC